MTGFEVMSHEEKIEKLSAKKDRRKRIPDGHCLLLILMTSYVTHPLPDSSSDIFSGGLKLRSWSPSDEQNRL